MSLETIILIFISFIVAVYYRGRLHLRGSGVVLLGVFALLSVAIAKLGALGWIVIVIVGGFILKSLFINYVNSVEINARNLFFQTVGLGNMAYNCYEAPPFGKHEISTDPMERAFTDGTNTVTFRWSDALRAEANRGREPSFTEPLFAIVVTPSGYAMYKAENLGKPSWATVELFESSKKEDESLPQAPSQGLRMSETKQSNTRTVHKTVTDDKTLPVSPSQKESALAKPTTESPAKVNAERTVPVVKFCRQCGIRLGSGIAVCPKCGTRVIQYRKSVN